MSVRAPQAGTAVSGSQPVINDLVLPYELGPTEQRVSIRFRLFLTRCLFSCLSILIMLGLWVWNTRFRGVTNYFDDPLIKVMYIVYGAITVLTLGVALGRWLFERRRLRAVTGQQVACQVNRSGMALGELQLSWAQVDGFSARTPWWSKLGHYELTGADGSARLLIDQLPVAPSTVANAVRIFSGDQVRLDTRRLDR
ncbi:MAG: hypothetical protein L0G99_01625 [Propionibacteriales bacterium]|nr:hypothetical protein [Propionibacteriales bacterium]